MGAGAVGVLVNMAPLPPGSHAESERARARSLLSADRAVKKETRDNRAALWEEMAMTKAWDLAFAWLQDEPHSHQASVLLAMMSTALGLEEGSSTMGHGMVWHHASG
eukprot:g18957.t1